MNVYLLVVYVVCLFGVFVMLDIYVLGERLWDVLMFGSDENVFIVMGLVLVSSFCGLELGFLFVCEMGYILVGYVFWKMVICFLVGEYNLRSGFLKNGVVGLFDFGKWLEGVIEVFLFFWVW